VSVAGRVASWPRWVWYAFAVVWALVLAGLTATSWALANDHNTALVFWLGWLAATLVQWVQLGWQDEQRRRARSVARARAEHAAREARIAERGKR
jgi:hypothetical protein